MYGKLYARSLRGYSSHSTSQPAFNLSKLSKKTIVAVCTMPPVAENTNNEKCSLHIHDMPDVLSSQCVYDHIFRKESSHTEKTILSTIIPMHLKKCIRKVYTVFT